MEWMNGMYIRNLSVGEFIERCQPYLAQAAVSVPADQFAALAPHVQERVKTMIEVAPMVDFLTDKPLNRELNLMFNKGIDGPKAREIVTRSVAAIEALPEFTVDAIDQALRGVATELGLKPGPAFGVLRVAVTGKTVTPPLFESFAVLGKDKVLSRLRETLDLIPQ
jgi:glutamyl-tRNA synthetase